MNSNKISILFLLQKSRINKQGKCPIRCRMTFLESRYEFSTGQNINPENWYSKLQLAKPPDQDNSNINMQLGLIKNKISQAFLLLQLKDVSFDVNDVYLTYKGEKPKKEKGVLENYAEYLARIKKLIGKGIEQVTYNKYVESYNHLRDFIKYQFKTSDLRLKDLKSNFLDEYDYYLKTQKGSNNEGLQQSTINKATQRFRRTLKYAMSETYIDSDPFVLHEAKQVKKKIIFLTTEELAKLENYTFQIQRIHRVKELFVFCCYTGLAFKEMSVLKKTDIFTGFDQKLWLDINRSKTSRDYKVPLLPKALQIIGEFNDDQSDLVFPRISNQKFNVYLKEIADVLGISKKLTHHVARKTFASTVLLFNDISIEIVSKLLGHAKITTTQESYGEVIDTKVSMALRKLI